MLQHQFIKQVNTSTETALKTSWVIDTLHSEVTFKVKHLVITTVTGRFKNFSGKVVTSSDDFTQAEITFTADVDSIDTGAESRDTHLKSGDFFDSEYFPQLTFVSTGLEKKGGHYVLNGDLTIRGTTQPVSLDVEFFGITKDPFYGKTKAGFEINGKIHRKDYALTWDALTETGGAVVSNEVKIHANIQLDRED